MEPVAGVIAAEVAVAEASRLLLVGPCLAAGPSETATNPTGAGRVITATAEPSAAAGGGDTGARALLPGHPRWVMPVLADGSYGPLAA